MTESMERDEWLSLQSMAITGVKDWAREADRHDAEGLPEIAHWCRMQAASLMFASAGYRLADKPEGGA